MKLYYTCKFCGETNELTGFWRWFFTPHFGNKKWFKCSKCGAKRHFMARKDCKWSMIDWPKSKGEN